MSVETPSGAVERALVSDRLDRVEDRLARLETLGGDGNALLSRLVDLGERRDQREEKSETELAESRRERGKWLRRMIRPELVIPYLLAGLGGASVTGAYTWPAQQAEVRTIEKRPTE